MFIVGERINGMFKDVAGAIASRNSQVITDLAQRQVRAGADALDVNVGPYAKEPASAMEWLIDTLIEAVDVPLAIDTTKLDVMEKGLGRIVSKTAGRSKPNRPIINSTSGDEEKMAKLFTLAIKYNAQIIGLTMNKKGIPQTADERIEIAGAMLARAVEVGIAPSDLYIDAVILPVNVAGIQVVEVLETIRQIRHLSGPPPHTILGLSNVSQGTLRRSLINRTCLSMAIGAGLDSAILDPLDKELMDELITAELLMARQLYCDSYLEAYRKK